MIRKDYKRFKKYCCEDISLIENYEKAVNDKTQTWCCHHKLEIELLKKPSELKEMGLYFDRPASELIFLTRSEHIKLHSLYREYTDEWKEKLKKPKSKGYSQNHILAVNTIKQAVTMINKFGLESNLDQSETDDEIVMTIRIKK